MAPSVSFTPTVGVAPGTTTMALNGARSATLYNPYATESQLRSSLRGLGLAGLGEARVGVGVVAAMLAFAAGIGYGFWRRGRR